MNPLCGIHTDDSNAPAHFVTDLGFGRVRQDCGKDKRLTFKKNCDAFHAAGLTVVATGHTIDDMLAIKATVPYAEPEYKNEVELPNLENGPNADYTPLAQYVAECEMLADLGVRCWIGCLSTVRNEATLKAFVQALAHVLPRHLGLVVHAYDYDPGHLAECIAMVRKYWHGALLISEWGPQPKIASPPVRAKWFAAARADVLKNGVPTILYRLINDGDNSGLVENRDWTTAGYSFNAAGLALKTMPSLG